ncbi:hypothetical protein ACWCWD_35940, partial [Streptomyces sp. NPDC001493]
IQQDSGQAGPTGLTALPWVNHRVRRWEKGCCPSPAEVLPRAAPRAVVTRRGRWRRRLPGRAGSTYGRPRACRWPRHRGSC